MSSGSNDTESISNSEHFDRNILISSFIEKSDPQLEHGAITLIPTKNTLDSPGLLFGIPFNFVVDFVVVVFLFRRYYGDGLYFIFNNIRAHIKWIKMFDVMPK